MTTSSSLLNNRQQHVLLLMRAHRERDLYETAGANPKVGSGYYALTYTADEKYEYLNRAEVRDLLDKGLIDCRWPGCFKLAGDKRYDRKGRELPNWPCLALRSEDDSAGNGGVRATPLLPCPVCGGEAIHAQEVLARTTVAGVLAVVSPAADPERNGGA